jgi:hypothetical protein
MAEDVAKTKAKHPYTQKTHVAMKSTRTPSPHHEISEEPELRKMRYPDGTLCNDTPSTAMSTDNEDVKTVNLPRSVPHKNPGKTPVNTPNLVHRIAHNVEGKNVAWKSPIDYDSCGTGDSKEAQKSAPVKKPTLIKDAPLEPNNLFSKNALEGLKQKMNKVLDEIQHLGDETGKVGQRTGAHLARSNRIFTEIKAIKYMIKELEQKVSANSRELKMLRILYSSVVRTEQCLKETPGQTSDIMRKMCEGDWGTNFVDALVETMRIHLVSCLNSEIGDNLVEKVGAQNLKNLESLVQDVIANQLNQEFENRSWEVVKAKAMEFNGVVEEALGKFFNVERMTSLMKNVSITTQPMERTDEEETKIRNLKEQIFAITRESYLDVNEHVTMTALATEKLYVQEQQGTNQLISNVGRAIQQGLVDRVTPLLQTVKTNHVDEMRGINNLTHRCEMVMDSIGQVTETKIADNEKFTKLVLAEIRDDTKSAIKECKEAVSDMYMKIGTGQSEIISVIESNERNTNAILNQLVTAGLQSSENEMNITARLTQLEALLSSLNESLTEIHGTVNAIPDLHKTMGEIVYVMNSTMGEELIPPVGTDIDKSEEEVVPKQRAARRVNQKKKK